MRKQVLSILAKSFLFLLLVIGAAFVRPAGAEAALKAVPAAGQPAKKIGKYYFWMKDNEIRFGKTTDGSYVGVYNTNDGGRAFTDGKTIYYLADMEGSQWLVSYSISKGRNTTLQGMPDSSNDEISYGLTAVMGKYLVINGWDFNKFNTSVYTYDIAGKELKKQISDGHVILSSGSTVIVEHGLRTDVSPFQVSIYKGAGGKLNKIKTLGNWCLGCEIIGKYLYYSLGTGPSADTAVVYRIKLTGKSRKNLGKINRPVYYVRGFTSKTCIVTFGGADYRYTYKTRQLKKI